MLVPISYQEPACQEKFLFAVCMYVFELAISK